MASGPDIRCEFDSEEEAIDSAWAWFGESPEKYAERIAPELVRQAAREKYGNRNVWLECEFHEDGETNFYVWTYSPDRQQQHGYGPDICAAALACIEDLGFSGVNGVLANTQTQKESK